jgi:uncharacterized membrane protein required for colicin V production
MTLIDFIIIFMFAFTTAIGFFFGLVSVIGAIATIVISIIVAGLGFNELAPILQPYTFNNLDLARVGAFIIIYWFSSLFLSLIVKIANKVFNLPVLKTVNRLLGSFVSLVGSILIVSVFFYLIKTYAWSEPVQEFIASSRIAVNLTTIGEFVSWVIPGL